MTDETVRFLHDLKLPGMAACWTSLEETHQLDKVSLRDGMQLMLQHERDSATHARRTALPGSSRTQASGRRPLSRNWRWTPHAGCPPPMSPNKPRVATYVTHGLGERACRQGYKTLYFTMNTLIDQLRLVHLEGRETNFFRKLSAHDLLIIDDFGMVRLGGQIQHDFEQIIDDRYNRKALILASQLPVADWYNVFQSELIAEACLDRIVHKSKRFELKGESLRKKY